MGQDAKQRKRRNLVHIVNLVDHRDIQYIGSVDSHLCTAIEVYNPLACLKLFGTRMLQEDTVYYLRDETPIYSKSEYYNLPVSIKVFQSP